MNGNSMGRRPLTRSVQRGGARPYLVLAYTVKDTEGREWKRGTMVQPAAKHRYSRTFKIVHTGDVVHFPGPKPECRVVQLPRVSVAPGVVLRVLLQADSVEACERYLESPEPYKRCGTGARFAIQILDWDAGVWDDVR